MIKFLGRETETSKNIRLKHDEVAIVHLLCQPIFQSYIVMPGSEVSVGPGRNVVILRFEEVVATLIKTDPLSAKEFIEKAAPAIMKHLEEEAR